MLLQQLSILQQQLHDHYVRLRCITDICQGGNVEMLRFLLLGTSIEWTAQEKKVGLVRACEFDQIEIVKFLIGVDGVDATCNFNQPIKTAVAYGNKNVVKLLIDIPGVNPGEVEYSQIYGEIDYKHLLTAAMMGNSDVLNIVLSRYVNRLDVKVLNEILSEFTEGYRMGKEQQKYFIHKFRKPSGQSVSDMYKLLLLVVGVDRKLAHDLFMAALSQGDVEYVNALMEVEQIDPMFNNHQWMREMGSHKRGEMVELLVKSDK
ncbi:hypothetical protein HDU76_011349, partial [Blyttiomyces sp. JEL0837]